MSREEEAIELLLTVRLKLVFSSIRLPRERR